MAKKYSPSGYQIIDLGRHDLSSTITINKGENADADVLIDLYTRGKISDKPILIRIVSGNSEMSGFCTRAGDFLNLWVSSSESLRVELGIDELEITFVG